MVTEGWLDACSCSGAHSSPAYAGTPLKGSFFCIYFCFIRWSSPTNKNCLQPPSMRLATFSV